MDAKKISPIIVSLICSLVTFVNFPEISWSSSDSTISDGEPGNRVCGKKIIMNCKTGKYTFSVLGLDGVSRVIEPMDCSPPTPPGRGKIGRAFYCAGSRYRGLKGAECAAFDPALGGDSQKVMHGWPLKKNNRDVRVPAGIERGGLGCPHLGPKSLKIARQCKGTPFVLERGEGRGRRSQAQNWRPNQSRQQKRRNGRGGRVAIFIHTQGASSQLGVIC